MARRESLDRLWHSAAEAGKLLIITHDNPDPDALATALALAKLTEVKAGVRSRICCNGAAGRAENRAVVRELRMKLHSARGLDWKRWPAVALVDAQPGTGNNCLPPTRVPDLVMDHHPLRPHTKGKILDVRPGYGACATIVTEQLFDAGVNIPSDLAAGLYYAISSETQDLGRESSHADAHAYARLYPLADKRKLSRILHPSLEHDYFTTLTGALLSAYTHGNIVACHLREVHHPDSLSLAADMLVRHERIGWSIVTGVFKGELHISVRTKHSRSRADRLLRRVLGPQGKAGGHDKMAGGQVSLKGLDRGEREDLQKDIVARFVWSLKRHSDFVMKPLIDPKDFISILTSNQEGGIP